MKITKRDNKGRMVKGSGLKHGLSNDPIYDCWVAMKARCNKENHPEYPNYGGRGIKVCEEWSKSFETFLKDMGNKPYKKATLDRIDVNKGYSKDNCRWISIQEQQKNRRNNNEVVGVHFEKSRNKYHAAIKRNGKNIFLGRFISIEDARKAREEAEIIYAV